MGFFRSTRKATAMFGGAVGLALILAGGCGDKGSPDTVAGSARVGDAAAPQAVHVGMSKKAMARGAAFKPQMLGLSPGGTAAELRFNWYSGLGEDSTGSFVRVFEGDVLVDTAMGRSGSTSGAKATADQKYQWHKAEVAGLKPNTEYTYWVSNDGKNWSEEYTYRTPSSGAFRFAAISDVQYNGQTDDIGFWTKIAEKIGDAGASIIVNAGDHVEYCNAASSGATAKDGEAGYTKFFSPKELRNIPIASVMGNHDQCQNFEDHFNLPNVNVVKRMPTGKSQASSEYNFSNYYFLYNKVLFVGLNTSLTPSDSTEAGGYVSAYRTIIQEAKSAHPNYDFLVVTHHKTTTSVSVKGHVLDKDIGYYVKAGLQKLMTEQEVDLVLTGHDHVYVRSKFMINNDTSTVAGKGTLYLTLKPGGQTRNYSEGYDGIGFDRTNKSYVSGFYSYDLTAFVNNYPFLQKYYRSAGTTDYYLPWSYDGHDMYNPSYPGYAIIDVAYGSMTIEIYDEAHGDGIIPYDTIVLKKNR